MINQKPVSTKFNSQVVLSKTLNGPKPMLNKAMIQKQGDAIQSSFLIKYWYIILPITVMLLLAGPEEKK